MMLFLLLVAATTASPLESSEPVASSEVALAGEEGEDREGKLFSVFQIVKFNNDACTAVDGKIGSCYTLAECTSLGGGDGGSCASGFGVCCISVVDPNCPVTIQLNNSYIVNPGFPGNLEPGAACASTSAQGRNNAQPRLFFPAAATTTTTISPEAAAAAAVIPATGKDYVYTVKKASASVVQFRIDFIAFEIAEPAMGMCTNESLKITGFDAVTEKVMPTNLCGVLTGQHVYISMKTAETLTITITVTGDREQKWNLLVRQFESTQTDYLAPRGCLQYFREDAATFSTFNHQSGDGELLNDHMYSVCLADNDAYCDVSLTSSAFDLKGAAGSCSDAVAFGVSPYCGQTFANMGTLLWNYTGSYNIPIMTDSDNTDMNSGFEISYIMLPC